MARSARSRPIHAILFTWLLLGSATWLLVPAARGGPQFGATAPFWLLGAPLLGLGWSALRGLAATHRPPLRPQALR